MLPRSRRIPRSEFKPILESRNYLNSNLLTLKIASNKDSVAKVAVSVSKKISKLAVVRNTTRRRIYSALFAMLPSLKPNLYLIIAKKGAEKVKGEKLKEELNNLFSSGKLIVSPDKKV